MNALTNRSVLAIGIAITSLGAMGCGVIIDASYLIGKKRYEEQVEDRRPTGQVDVSTEYNGAVGPDGLIRISCHESERNIERQVFVDKTYQYRGGYQRSVYVSAAALSGVVGGAMVGIIAGLCNTTPPPGKEQLSCINMLYATPFALDMGWAIARAITAKPPKLVDKRQTTSPSLALATTPSRTKPIACDSIDRVVLGTVWGPSDEELLNGMGGGTAARLNDGAIPIVIPSDGAISLSAQPEVVHAWVTHPMMGLWVINREGNPRRLTVDRCPALRSAIAVMTSSEQYALGNTCQIGPPVAPPR